MMPRSGAACVCLLLAFHAAADTRGVKEDVDVLVFLPKNNSYLFSFARVAPAILYAQRRLHDAPLYSGINFNIQFANSDCVNEALFQLVERACGDHPDLILGPVCEYEAAAVVRLASHWDVPVISAGALAAAFSSKRGEFSQLTRIAASYVKMAETFSAMFQHFSWRSALLVYEDDREERNCFFTVEGVFHRLAEHSVRTYELSQEERLDPEDVLRSLQDSEVVIMCMGADRIREIMLAAHRRRLTGSYIFFNVDLFNATSYGNGSWQRGDQFDQEARLAYAALNTVTLLRTVKPEFENFSMEMKKSSSRMEVDDCKDCGSVRMTVSPNTKVNTFVEGFHDAMLLYAIALDEAMTNGFSKKNGTEVTSRMWNRTFEGIAGQVTMDVNGDREGDFSLMSMTNVEAGTYEVVANYFGVNGTFQLLPAFSSDRFVLTGRHKTHTEKADKGCGLGVSALTGVIVGAVLGTAMLITFYFFRKNYRITIERRSHSEECDIGKHRQLREDSIRSNFSAA